MKELYWTKITTERPPQNMLVEVKFKNGQTLESILRYDIKTDKLFWESKNGGFLEYKTALEWKNISYFSIRDAEPYEN